MEHTGGPFWDFGPFCGYTIHHNIFRNGGNGYAVKYNGGCYHNIFTNNVMDNVAGRLEIYGTSNYNRITNNLIRSTSREGIWVWGYHNIVKGNIISHPGTNGITLRAIWNFDDPSMNKNTVIGNLIINPVGHGISLQKILFPYQYTVNITGNTIYKAGEDGIRIEDEQNTEYYVCLLYTSDAADE